MAKSSSAYCSAASMGRTNVWLNCEPNSKSVVLSVSLSIDCSIRFVKFEEYVFELEFGVGV